ncbi:Alpha-1,2-mannosyltransferase ALG9 [Geodia barretti]|uniref:Mannosyltransferase n=1 Tax=Geodia barretti TaxID=519541 RepID=A0AA35TWU5_GEOBA|nr:Alpha-1,2-mannosyltransferase ALG9 [Geodia barretti]
MSLAFSNFQDTHSIGCGALQEKTSPFHLISFVVVSVPLVAIDSVYYGRPVLAPLNIVLYNVFGKGGPNLYGVEPLSYYLINGVLNFNVVFILALLAPLAVEFQV